MLPTQGVFLDESSQFFKMKLIPGINFILKSLEWLFSFGCCNVCCLRSLSLKVLEHRKHLL